MRSIISFCYVLAILLTIVFLTGCCPDRVEPTVGHTVIPSEPHVGDTVEFTDHTNAANIKMSIYIDSLGSGVTVCFKPDDKLGQLGYNSTFSKERLTWDYPRAESYYIFDTTNRFRTRFVISRKVSKLIISRIARNFYRRCDGLMMHENSPVEVIKLDTIYVK